MNMSREVSCLECGKVFLRDQMIKGTKTNEYGDQEVTGYICKPCYQKRIEKRSKILLFGALSFCILGIILFLTIPFYYFTAEIILEVEFRMVVESFSLWGLILEVFGVGLYIVRYYELRRLPTS